MYRYIYIHKYHKCIPVFSSMPLRIFALMRMLMFCMCCVCILFTDVFIRVLTCDWLSVTGLPTEAHTVLFTKHEDYTIGRRSNLKKQRNRTNMIL